MPRFNKQIFKIHDIDYEEIEHLNKLDKESIRIAVENSASPDGFIISSKAHENFLKENFLIDKIRSLLSTVHFERPESVMQVSNHIKKLITTTKIPKDLEEEIMNEYKNIDNFLRTTKVKVGNKKEMIKGYKNVIEEVKNIWAERFDPKELIHAHKNKLEHFKKAQPIIVRKHIDFKTSGKLLTSELKIESGYSLSENRKKQLKVLGAKLKKELYIPYEISWGIKNNKLYIIEVKPMTNTQKAYLVLIRHGRSEYNEKGLWAGWDEPPLTENGREDIRVAAETLKDIHFDLAYTSHLIRHQQTIYVLKKALNRKDLQVIINDSLLERNYGDFTAKNKWEVEKQIGKSEFTKLRRSWDYPVPNGESLKNVYDRVVPYYKNDILPKLKSGKNVVIASSGNALRSLVKYLENISDEDISKLEIATGEVYVYQIDEDGKVVNKEIRNQHENKV